MKTVIGFIAVIAFYGVIMAISLGIVRFFAGMFAEPNVYRWEIAYVSESPNARCFHYTEQCKALRHTTYEIESLSVDDAEDCGYEPCSLCLKESARKNWDDAAEFVFFPVIGLILLLIHKIDKFSKKYQFRSPIAKRDAVDANGEEAKNIN